MSFNKLQYPIGGELAASSGDLSLGRDVPNGWNSSSLSASVDGEESVLNERRF